MTQIEKYKLKLGKTTFGTIRDSFTVHNNMKFSTYDDDNDLITHINCAELHNSGWWFNGCYDGCLTGTRANQNTNSGNWLMNDASMGPQGLRHFSHTKMLTRPRSL